MSKPKVYILQKDLPDAKAGDRYIRSLHEPIYYHATKTAESWDEEIVEYNPEWFLPEEEREYTRTQLISCIKDAFEAARLNHPMVGFKYDKVEDYLKTLIL